jgi:hypothetical protein
MISDTDMKCKKCGGLMERKSRVPHTSREKSRMGSDLFIDIEEIYW